MVNRLAPESLLHLRVHLERRARVLVTDLPRHVRKRWSRLDQREEEGRRARPAGARLTAALAAWTVAAFPWMTTSRLRASGAVGTATAGVARGRGSVSSATAPPVPNLRTTAVTHLLERMRLHIFELQREWDRRRRGPGELMMSEGFGAAPDPFRSRSAPHTAATSTCPGPCWKIVTLRSGSRIAATRSPPTGRPVGTRARAHGGWQLEADRADARRPVAQVMAALGPARCQPASRNIREWHRVHIDNRRSLILR
jgi:hypothetical protein